MHPPRSGGIVRVKGTAANRHQLGRMPSGKARPAGANPREVIAFKGDEHPSVRRYVAKPLTEYKRTHSESVQVRQARIRRAEINDPLAGQRGKSRKVVLASAVAKHRRRTVR